MWTRRRKRTKETRDGCAFLSWCIQGRLATPAPRTHKQRPFGPALSTPFSLSTPLLAIALAKNYSKFEGPNAIAGIRTGGTIRKNFVPHITGKVKVVMAYHCLRHQLHSSHSFFTITYTPITQRNQLKMPIGVFSADSSRRVDSNTGAWAQRARVKPLSQAPAGSRLRAGQKTQYQCQQLQEANDLRPTRTSAR